MLPIRDTYPSASPAIVTWTIVLANVLVFWYESSLPVADLQIFVHQFGFTPALFLAPGDIVSRIFENFTIVSSMFIHGSLGHLVGNMWMLVIFADNIEDAMGHFRFFIFYILMGTMAALSQAIFIGDPNTPTIGASGAIAGILGGYCILFPESKIITLIPIFIFPWFVEISAWFFLIVWFLLQFLSGLHPDGDGASVAWWAHVGGFVAGITSVHLFVRKKTRLNSYPDQYQPW
jgi:membrane associated rhomboid family serine protease